MDVKYKVIVALLIIIVAFTAGRMSVKTETVSHNEQSTESETDNTRVITRVITRVVEKDPTGAERETTRTEENIRSDTSKREASNSTSDTKKTTGESSNFNISALAAFRSDARTIPLYGLSVNKQIMGPITMGAFGFTDGTVGVSLGFSF